ncbi:MAG: hypothetical protein ACQRW7_11485 [Caulobacterales bacterium]|uniref:hypothetical protein n=1 Tax=Glycocaulis sp. TaxID=1969725 RepID=UPI003F9F2BF0
MTRPGFPRTRRLRQRDWQGEPANGVRRWLTGALAATIVFLLLIAAITDLRGQGVEGCRNDAGWISCESQLAEGGAA